ncbi:RNA 3'-terminal phosphate cyclase, partial [Viridothelium virens]
INLLGTTLEGGGQLVRVAVGVSALTETPIHVTKIRGGRAGAQGLKQQHLTCVRWLSRASNARTLGAEKKSLELHFQPRGIAEDSLLEENIDIGSPGSISLTLQAILPILLFSPNPSSEPRHVTIKGGVNVDLSPSYEYSRQVLVPTLALIGLPLVKTSLGKREWTQKNQATGSVNYAVQPLPRGATFRAFTLQDRGPVTRVHATIISPPRYQSELQQHILSVIASYTKLSHLTFATQPTDDESPPVDFTLETPGSTKTTYVLLVAHTTTGHRLGTDLYLSKFASSSSTPSNSTHHNQHHGPNTTISARQRRSKRPPAHSASDNAATTDAAALPAFAERVVADLAAELAHGGAVDTHMRDQLVVYQALAEGRSYEEDGKDGGRRKAREASLHTRTAEWVCEKLLRGRGVRFDGLGGCEGCGWVVG